MFQAHKKDDALDIARILASSTSCPVLVMGRHENGLSVYSVGLRTEHAMRQSGVHVATVYRSGSVDNECLKTRWFRFRRCLCEKEQV